MKMMKLEALLRRLPAEHSLRERISADYSKQKAGYTGERNLDYPLSYLEDDWLILHDVRLQTGVHFFQMDTLILTSSCLFILEVKNISGSLFFDTDFNQLIRTKEEASEAFPDPLMQADRQQWLLAKWLQHSPYPNIPIETLVVISSPRTILQTSPNNHSLYNKVIHSMKLSSVIPSVAKKYQDILNREEVSSLAELILQCHHPQDVDILSRYKLNKSDLLSGVRCPACSYLPLIRRMGSWHCSKCGERSSTAHLQALRDYWLLMGPSITNKIARQYLGVSSESTMRKILKGLKIPSEGHTKDRIHYLTESLFKNE